MTEWQQQTETTSLRTKWMVMLAEALEQVEARYIMAEIDAEEYHAQLKELDGKLAIIGLSLASKPWINSGAKRL